MSILGVLSKIEKCNKKKKKKGRKEKPRHKGRGVGPAERVRVHVRQWTRIEDYLLQCFCLFSCNVTIVAAE